MPNLEELLNGVSPIVTAKAVGFLYFKVLDLKYAYSQLTLTAETAKQCSFNIVGGRRPVHIVFLPDSMVWLICQLNSKSNGSHPEQFKEHLSFLG